MSAVLAVSGNQFSELKAHLFPGDGREAAAILLCRNAGVKRKRLVAHTIVLVPQSECVRDRDTLTWPGARLEEAIDAAEPLGLSIMLVHSHPSGLFQFSSADNESDAHVVPAIFGGWSGAHPPLGHGSMIMTPDERMRGRVYDADGRCEDLEHVAIIGDDIHFHFPDDGGGRPMAFGSRQTALLKRLHACVIGASGTGSIVAEQAVRLGFGQLTLIDFDTIEEKNLNRILNATKADAERVTLKVEMLARAFRAVAPELTVHAIADTVASRAGVLAAGECDVIFSCVDSAAGRQIADLLAQAYVMPLIDMGVTIPTRRTQSGEAAIADVLGRIDYVQPGGSSLFNRGVFSAASLRAEYLISAAPLDFAAEREAGYIRGAPEEAPSVISLNMRAASAAMLEFIARVFPFRQVPNRNFARTKFSLAEPEEETFSEDSFDAAQHKPPRGAVEPLLGIPALGPEQIS